MDGLDPPDIAASGAGAPCGSEACASALSAALLRLDELEAENKELRLEVISERARAGSCSAQQKMASAKLAQARELSASLRRAAKDALALQAEVDRLTRLVDEMGIDARKRSTIVSLRQENGDLRRQVAVLLAADDEGGMASRIEKLEAKVKLLKAMQSNSAKRAFGRRSEKRKRRRQGTRGQRPGAAGHGRTPRPGLERRPEVHDPDETTCGCCGKAYARHGGHESEIIEIEVKAHKRVIVRPRYHATCDCSQAGSEVVAPAPARLFANTPFGTSVWAMALLEKFRFHRPHRQVASWMTNHGLPMSAGTLCSALPRFEPLFAPLSTAILARVNAAPVQQGDETTWRIQERGLKGGSQRAWLWIALSADAVFYHVDPSRSAKAAQILFGGALKGTVLVCDRFSSYKALAKALGLILAYCWAHVRRDYLECDGSQTTPWKQAWVDRIDRLLEINRMRRQHHDPHRHEQTADFKAAQRMLEEACNALFDEASRDLEDRHEDEPEAKILRSLLNHRQGLEVFVSNPATPIDNNSSEGGLRGPAIARKLSFGSDSVGGARVSAMFYSLFATLQRNGIDCVLWLRQWLDACAANGGRPPHDLAPWLPWLMTPARKAELSRPPPRPP